MAKLEAIGLGALAVVACTIAAGFWLQPSHPDALINSTGAALLVLFVVLAVGIPAVAVVAAPLYFFLWRRGRASVFAVAALGLLPPALTAAVDRGAALGVLAVGAPTVLLMHWGARRWLRPHNSSRPMPRPDAA